MKSGIDPKTFGGETFEKALKMETSTNISITLNESKKVTIVADTANKSIKVNTNKKTTDENGILTENLAAGTYAITKGDSINVYAIIFE